MTAAAKSPEFLAASAELARELGQEPAKPTPGETFVLRSKSRGGHTYEMLVTPEGYVVHQGEGCEGEIFNGPLGCWHSKTGRKLDMTTAVTTYQPGAVAEMREYTESDVATLKATICKGASDAELKLFVATCQHTGLDPFMRQIHAVMRNQRVGDKYIPQMTIQIGIDGYRLIANRTGEMQGMDGPQWTYDGKTWEDLPHETGNPLAARCMVYRKGVERGFSAVCRWSAYVQTTTYNNQTKPNAQWSRMGPEMLAKCAEALALRRAFPAEMAALPTAPDFIDPEEWQLEQQSWTPSPDAIEGERVETPADTTEAPEAPFPDDPRFDSPEDTQEEALTLDDAKKAITEALTAIKGHPQYLTIYSSLKRFMPDGKSTFNPDGLLDAAVANECLGALRLLVAGLPEQ